MTDILATPYRSGGLTVLAVGGLLAWVGIVFVLAYFVEGVRGVFRFLFPETYATLAEKIRRRQSKMSKRERQQFELMQERRAEEAHRRFHLGHRSIKLGSPKCPTCAAKTASAQEGAQRN